MTVNMSQQTKGEEATDADIYVRLAEAIADAKDVDVLALDPLYDSLDGEALTQLTRSFEDSPASMESVNLEVAGCEVTVTTDDAIEVTVANAATGD